PCRSVRRHRSPLFLFLFHVLRPPLPLHSFPTRRSSDLPFFAAMVVLLADHDGPGVLATYLPALEREYAFWMDGAESLAPGAAHRRVVRLADGTLLNRYWDDCDTPRDESHIMDVATAAASPRPAPEVYRNLRAGAESGWDFSSRWLADGRSLHTIRTVELLPPDL